MKTLYVIDYSNWVYRTMSVYNYKRTINGISYDYSALVGFIRSLKALPFDDVVICLDGTPEQSLKVLPSYKGQRIKEPNESLSFSKSELVKILSKISTVDLPLRRSFRSKNTSTEYGRLNKNIKIAYSAGQEADQVISSICYEVANNIYPEKNLIPKQVMKFSNLSRRTADSDNLLKKFCPATSYSLDLSEYDTVIISTTDSDMYQLLSLGNVFIDMSISGKSLNNQVTPVAVHNLSPLAIPAYKTFVGDVSDNVPSLDINLKQTDLVKFISDNFSKGEFQKFYDAVCSYHYNRPYQHLIEPQWSSLFNHIVSTNQVKEFMRNYSVVKLQFYSTPYVLDYGDSYDIEKAVKKYKIYL